jgi:hypothetical protein
MTTPRPEWPNLTGHELLLRLAGRIPDRALADARRMLADGETAPAIALVADVVAEYEIPLTASELLAIRELTGDAGALSQARPVADPPALSVAFTEIDEYGEVRRDELDEAMVAAAESHGTGLTGLWRSWRYPFIDGLDDADDAPPAARASVLLDPDHPDQLHRVYVAQVEEPAMIERLSGDLLDAAAGQAGVEVITLAGEPPPYQAAALAQSMLVWATVSAAEFEVARVFDFADPVTGPGFAPGHAVIDDEEEREQLLGYLHAGIPVLITTAGHADILDSSVGAVVPTSFRTDGEWIWTDSVEYYLSRHGLAPDARLLARIRAQFARGEIVPDTDQDTAIRAADFLLHPPAEQARTAVWFPGEHPAERT